MSLQERVTVVENRTNKLAFDSTGDLNVSASTFDCRVCLWVFESKSEFDVHNSLEHMITNHVEHKRKTTNS